MTASARLAAAAPKLAALLLGVASIVWTAIPVRQTGLAGIALVVSIIAVAMSALRLALAEVPLPESGYFQSPLSHAWQMFLAMLRELPWEEMAVLAILWLEVQHLVRPWHTFALGLGLTAYLLTVHIAESGADTGRLLRRQAGVLVAGVCLLALGAGFATLAAAGPGAGSALLRVLAAVAVVVAAALVLPGRPSE